jgi:type IV secretion system protein TrbC
MPDWNLENAMTFKLRIFLSRGCFGRGRQVTQPVIIGCAAGAAIMLLTVSVAHAAGSGMPWEAPLERILESVQGPVAKIVAVIIITVTGISLAFGDTSGGFRKMIQVVFGLSIAFAASSFFLSFFSFGGGALI